MQEVFGRLSRHPGSAFSGGRDRTRGSGRLAPDPAPGRSPARRAPRSRRGCDRGRADRGDPQAARGSLGCRAKLAIFATSGERAGRLVRSWPKQATASWLRCHRRRSRSSAPWAEPSPLSPQCLRSWHWTHRRWVLWRLRRWSGHHFHSRRLRLRSRHPRRLRPESAYQPELELELDPEPTTS